MMDDALQDLKAATLLGTTMPALAFFKPTDRFWTALRCLPVPKDGGLVDVGTGMGHVPEAAQTKGLQYRVAGIDLCHRPGQWRGVLHADGRKFIWTEACWPLICRPSHDGWCEDVLVAALEHGAGAVYVGKNKGVRNDLGTLFKQHTLWWPNVGEEREGMWFFKPRRTRNGNS